MILGAPTSTPVVVRKRYQHSRERVFDAFARARSLEQWFAPAPGIKIHATEFCFELGGRYRLAFTLPSGDEIAVYGEYLALHRPRHLRFTWQWEEPDPHAGIPSVVNVDFVDIDGATEVVVSHEQLNTPPAAERHALGWVAILDRLVRHLGADFAQ